MDFFKKAEPDTDGNFAKGPGMAEKMIANMLGFTPDEMAKTLTDFRDTILKVAETMARIEAKLDVALAQQKVIENGGHNASVGTVGSNDRQRDGRDDGHDLSGQSGADLGNRDERSAA